MCMSPTLAHGPIINKQDASVTRSQKAAREDARRDNSHRKDPPPKGPQIEPDYAIYASICTCTSQSSMRCDDSPQLTLLWLIYNKTPSCHDDSCPVRFGAHSAVVNPASPLPFLANSMTCPTLLIDHVKSPLSTHFLSSILVLHICG